MKKLIVIVTFITLLTVQVVAQAFVASKIEFVGLQRIPSDTAMSYLPIRPGAKVTAQTSDSIIRALYKTGFFSNVALDKRGSTLVIHVQERPVISKLTLSGNKVVSSKELLKVLKKMSVANGYEYNRSTLQTIKSALLNEYYSHGKYNARVNIQVTKQPHNEVAVSILISEGLTATVKQIHIIGNKAFSESKLLDQFQLTTPGLLSFFNHDDQYSSQKLAADLHSLTAYYMNRGYLKFRILGTQVSLSPDRKHVYITVKVHEGNQYHFSGFSLAGRLILPRAQLRMLSEVQKGAIFSNQAIINTETNIGNALGAKGYYETKVSAKTRVNEAKKTIFITFEVSPGQRIYVRRIYFSGNSGTNDQAFRRELTQMEGGLISTVAVQNSKRRLLQLPFVRNVDVSTTPVPSHSNEVDVGYKVATMPAGQVRAGVGYSDVDGPMFNVGLNQQNVFGTGNSFGFNAAYSASMLSAMVSYFNPYYTKWGIGRGFSLYASHYNASEANTADYETDNYGGAINYSIPISQYDSAQFSVGLNYMYLDTNSNPATIIQDFVNEHGKNFTQIPINIGWTHNSLDQANFPTSGLLQNLNFTFSAPAGSNALEYYKATYNLAYYHPIYASFVGKLRGGVGYGDGYGSYSTLPFMKNFYLGGMGSVRGYEANTIGPIDSAGDTIGGNLYFDTSAELIVPNPLSRSVRTALFVDAGNVYATHMSASEKTLNPDRNRIRYSAGLEVDWLSPIGLLNFSLAKAINPAKNDDTQVFQFNIGASV